MKPPGVKRRSTCAKESSDGMPSLCFVKDWMWVWGQGWNAGGVCDWGGPGQGQRVTQWGKGSVVWGLKAFKDVCIRGGFVALGCVWDRCLDWNTFGQFKGRKYIWSVIVCVCLLSAGHEITAGLLSDLKWLTCHYNLPASAIIPQTGSVEPSDVWTLTATRTHPHTYTHTNNNNNSPHQNPATLHGFL